MYSVIDLFAGAGGLSLGFQQTKKFDIKVAFENNPAMQRSYRRNHPGVDVRGDVCSADYSAIMSEYGRIDVIIGGPPCQGFSNANRQKNHAISHNNALVKEYVRAIVEVRPKAFVMENVSMLRSETHRFYLSKNDADLVASSAIQTKKTPIKLLDENLVFDEVINLIKEEDTIHQYLWDERDYQIVNVVYKASKNVRKLIDALEKHRTNLIRTANDHLERLPDQLNRIHQADRMAFTALLNYYDKQLQAQELKQIIEPAVMYQKMFNYSLEILKNGIVVDQYTGNRGLYAEVRSFAVIDYIKSVLGDGDDNSGYVIKTDVLSATDFGAPQKRQRFVIIGIRKDVGNTVKLPKGKCKNGPYRTVWDAISDIEDVEPVTDTSDDVGIRLKEKKQISVLARQLRDSDILRNHIITKTRETAMERFKSLKQGENFHSLKDSLKSNTYTDISRTQNTIYRRLDYSQPSDTVVNVRKSMWIHPVKDRAVSVREAARLQTFPDSFIFEGTKDQQYQQVGNAVPPIMAKAVANTLAAQLIKAEQRNNGR